MFADQTQRSQTERERSQTEVSICTPNVSVRRPTLGHYLLHISFSSGTFSNVRAGGRPLPLYHYSPTANKISSWDSRGHAPCERSDVWVYMRSDILGTETSFSCFAVPVLNQHVNQQHRRLQSAKSYNNGQRSGSQKSMRAGDEKLICNK